MWISTPGGRPYDTSYAPMNIATVNGMRLLVTGGSDGAALAMKPQTGEPVWRLVAAKRGLNTGIVVNGNVAILSHSEENLSGNAMGMLAAFDATKTGELGPGDIKWQKSEFLAGFSSPVIDGDRFYQIDNSANLVAFDVQTGRELWRQSLGTFQKASAVFGDGKIYAGTENGKFYILRPHEDRCESSERSGFAAQQARPVLERGARAGDRGRGDRARPGIFRLERHAVCDRAQENVERAVEAGEAQPGAGRGRPGLGAGGADRTGAEARGHGATARAPL